MTFVLINFISTLFMIKSKTSVWLTLCIFLFAKKETTYKESQDSLKEEEKEDGSNYNTLVANFKSKFKK